MMKYLFWVCLCFPLFSYASSLDSTRSTNELPLNKEVRGRVPLTVWEYVQRKPVILKGNSRSRGIFETQGGIYFEVDNLFVGRSYRAANLAVDVDSIDHVVISREMNDRGRYGTRCASLVIMVYTKAYTRHQMAALARQRAKRLARKNAKKARETRSRPQV